MYVHKSKAKDIGSRLLKQSKGMRRGREGKILGDTLSLARN